MSRFLSSIALAIAVFLLTTAFLPAADPIPADKFEKVHALIRPQADEDQWGKIPWLTDLWEAREKAAKEGKPILLWEMDGHPLGCV